MRSRINHNLFYAALWLGATPLLYFYVHPYTTIIPLWLFSGALM